MVKKKDGATESTKAPTQLARNVITPLVESFAKHPWRNGGIAAVALITIVQLVLAFGSSATGLAESYKSAVNSQNVDSLKDPNLFPQDSSVTELPTFLENSFTPFTVAKATTVVDESGREATISIETTEGVAYSLDATKKESWFGPFWVSQWQLTSQSPTIRMSVDQTLPETLDYTFGEMPFTTKDIAEMTAVDSNYAVLPGVLTYTEPEFGFLSGGEQNTVVTTGSQRVTLGAEGEKLDGEVVTQAEKKFAKSVVRCSKKKRCASLPRYKDREFSVKKPAGSWDRLSTFDSYKVGDCAVTETTFVSAVEARVNFDCGAKVTRTFVWSDTYEQGFVWGWWYFYWYETDYNTKKGSQRLTVSGESAVVFDAARERFSSSMVSFDSIKK